MAKENNISVILFAQIRKLMEYSHKNDIKPRLEDMGESYSDYNFEDVHYNTPRFSDRHNYGGMTRNRYICKKEENQNGKTI